MTCVTGYDSATVRSLLASWGSDSLSSTIMTVSSIPGISNLPGKDTFVRDS